MRLRRWKPSQVAGRACAAELVVDDQVGGGAGDVATTEGEDDMATKTLKVEGMMCEHCVAHVTKALEGVKGVKNVRVSLDEGTAVVDAGLLVSDKSLVAAVEEAGYKAEMA